MKQHPIQTVVDDLDYWDCRVVEFSSNHFMDETQLTYEQDEHSNVVYRFLGCYKVNMDSSPAYKKDRPYKELTRAQIPFFLQDVEVFESFEEGETLTLCKISMPPISFEVLCREMLIERVGVTEK